MRKVKAQLLVAGAILVVAVGYLAYAGTQKGWVYYLEVDQYLAKTDMAGRRVRLHGKVSPDGFSVRPALLTGEFHLTAHTNPSRALAVVYHGAVPDMLQPGRDVVVEGAADPAGVFQADILLTKCASKYEAAGAPHSGKAAQ